jgi:hypothetical protein
MDQTFVADADLHAVKAALKAAKDISFPLKDSPSQNEARRRDVLGNLQNAEAKLTTFLGKVTAVGWKTEADAISTTLSAIKDLSGQVTETNPKTGLSWAYIDQKIAACISSVAQNENLVSQKALQSCQEDVASVSGKIDAFKPTGETLAKTDWEQIDSITNDALNSAKKCQTFPLAPLSPWNVGDAINTQLGRLDVVIAKFSGKFANSVESATRQIGLQPQTGRKAAIWSEANKWYLLGALLILLVLSKKA